MRKAITHLILALFFHLPVLDAPFQAYPCENILLENNQILFSKERAPILLSFVSEQRIIQRGNCGPPKPYVGYFPDSKIGFLDFDNNAFCGIDRPGKDHLIETGFKEVKARFLNHGFSIFVMIKRKEYEFQFDTSYTGTFCMEYKESIPFLKENHRTIEGVSNDFIYNNKWITINKLYYSATVTVSDGVKYSKVGMGFIKGFNWIVDTKQKKVYIKKNNIGLDTQIHIKPYVAEVRNGQLVICSKDTRARTYNLQDVIATINGADVNAQNICAMAELLSVTDWQSLDIKVAPPQ
jgi:hypothetical protein